MKAKIKEVLRKHIPGAGTKDYEKYIDNIADNIMALVHIPAVALLNEIDQLPDDRNMITDHVAGNGNMGTVVKIGDEQCLYCSTPPQSCGSCVIYQAKCAVSINA